MISMISKACKLFGMQTSDVNKSAMTIHETEESTIYWLTICLAMESKPDLLVEAADFGESIHRLSRSLACASSKWLESAETTVTSETLVTGLLCFGLGGAFINFRGIQPMTSNKSICTASKCFLTIRGPKISATTLPGLSWICSILACFSAKPRPRRLLRRSSMKTVWFRVL